MGDHRWGMGTTGRTSWWSRTHETREDDQEDDEEDDEEETKKRRSQDLALGDVAIGGRPQD